MHLLVSQATNGCTIAYLAQQDQLCWLSVLSKVLVLGAR